MYLEANGIAAYAETIEHLFEKGLFWAVLQNTAKSEDLPTLCFCVAYTNLGNEKRTASKNYSIEEKES